MFSSPQLCTVTSRNCTAGQPSPPEQQQSWFNLTTNPYLFSSASSPCCGPLLLQQSSVWGGCHLPMFLGKTTQTAEHFSLPMVWEMKTFQTTVACFLPLTLTWHFNTCYLPSSQKLIAKIVSRCKLCTWLETLKVSSELVYVCYRLKHKSTALLLLHELTALTYSQQMLSQGV